MAFIKDLIAFATEDESLLFTFCGMFFTFGLAYEIVQRYGFWFFVMGIFMVFLISGVCGLAKATWDKFCEFRFLRRN